uniref:Uncharacterized protein n=1 Tax=Oryza glaberrima TaxID=4538 RepID=I1P1Y0_ORYGL
MPTRQSNAVLSRSGSVYVKTTGTQTEGPAESQRSGQVKGAIIQMHMTSELDKLGQTKLILLLLYDNNLQLHQYKSARLCLLLDGCISVPPSRQRCKRWIQRWCRNSLPGEKKFNVMEKVESLKKKLGSKHGVSLALAKAYPSLDPFASFAPCQ